MTIFHLSKAFPREEIYSLTDQIRRSSRSVSSNLAEAWQKRRYEAAFIAKLSDAAAEAAETQNWLDYASSCGYLAKEKAGEVSAEYDGLLRSIHGMIDHASDWCRK